MAFLCNNTKGYQTTQGDRNQIPHGFTAGVTTRFKGLDLIGRVADELCTEVRDTVQEAGIMTIPKRKKWKKTKWLSEETLQTAEKRSERQRRKGKIYPSECRVPKKARRDKKPSSVVSAKKQRKTIEWERLENSSRKLEIPREHFMQKWAQKGQKWYGRNRNRRY